MQFKRIIARLDIKSDQLVKGIHLEGLKKLGAPWHYTKYYADSGIDEIFYQDAVASLYGRNSLFDIVQKTADNIFIPMAVGGGIRTADDVSKLLQIGADKVVINSAAIENPSLIVDLCSTFGSSTISISIDCKKLSNGEYVAFTDNGRNNSGLDVASWAQQVESLGAGEIILTSIDQDGTANGFEVEVAKMIRSSVNIPLVCSGGAGKLEHLSDVLAFSDGVSIASVLHYEHFSPEFVDNKHELSSFNLEQEDYQFAGDKLTVPMIKQFLQSNNIPVRI